MCLNECYAYNQKKKQTNCDFSTKKKNTELRKIASHVTYTNKTQREGGKKNAFKDYKNYCVVSGLMGGSLSNVKLGKYQNAIKSRIIKSLISSNTWNTLRYSFLSLIDSRESIRNKGSLFFFVYVTIGLVSFFVFFVFCCILR